MSPGPVGATTTTPLKKEDWEKVQGTSSYYYSELGKSTENCTYSGYNQHNLKGEILGACPGIQDDAEQIANAWCYVSNRSDGMNNEVCYFFYFWVGNMLLSRSGGTSFQESMRKIYDVLKEETVENTCADVYEDMDEKKFAKRKTAYEYSEDYNVVNGQIHDHNSTCNKACSQYLEEAFSTYSEVYDGCAGQPKSNLYCEEFIGENGKHQGKKLTKLTCTVVDESQIQAHMGGGGSSTPTAIISSTLATTVGLPAAVAFFLYKYNLLPFGIKNTLFGGNNNSSNNRSRKRRRERRSVDHHFDVFTEDDSTYDSATDNASTIEDWSTTSSSTINRTNRGRANNNKNQQRQRRTNIRYQNM